jgi:hypothetical protein
MGIKIKRKLGERIVQISNDLNIPRVTVESVIRAYLDGLVDSAQNGETIVIDNIMSIKLVEDSESGNVRLRGRVSPSLKNKLYTKSMSEVGKEDSIED